MNAMNNLELQRTIPRASLVLWNMNWSYIQNSMRVNSRWNNNWLLHYYLNQPALLIMHNAKKALPSSVVWEWPVCVCSTPLSLPLSIVKVIINNCRLMHWLIQQLQQILQFSYTAKSVSESVTVWLSILVVGRIFPIQLITHNQWHEKI